MIDASTDILSLVRSSSPPHDNQFPTGNSSRRHGGKVLTVLLPRDHWGWLCPLACSAYTFVLSLMETDFPALHRQMIRPRSMVRSGSVTVFPLRMGTAGMDWFFCFPVKQHRPGRGVCWSEFLGFLYQMNSMTVIQIRFKASPEPRPVPPAFAKTSLPRMRSSLWPPSQTLLMIRPNWLISSCLLEDSGFSPFLKFWFVILEMKESTWSGNSSE